MMNRHRIPSMPRFFILLYLASLLPACSVYSSAGRKQFEEKAPSNIIQPFAFLGCRELSFSETWLKEEFPSTTSELIDMTPNYEVWLRMVKNSSVEITVLSRQDPSDQSSGTQSCLYEFSSTAEWKSHKKSFLSDLSNTLY